MTKEYKCNHCKNHFQDGEFVSKKDSDNGLYHTKVRYLNIYPTATCLEASVMNQFGRRYKTNYLYYKGKLHNILAMDMLPNLQQLLIDINDNKNGDKLVGNLEGLVNKGFFSGILNKIFYC